MRVPTAVWLALAVGAGASGAFAPPSENERLGALGNRFLESEVMQRLLLPDADFPPIAPPHPGDWLAEHPEDGQTFLDYLDSAYHRPQGPRHILYLQPFGEFPEDRSPPLEDLRAYAAAYFQVEVRVLPAVTAGPGEFSPRVNPHTQRRQVLTADIRRYLAAHLPADAFCLLGVTMEDLYPAPSWNYVFGEASLSERVGVYSFARYDPAFFDEERPAGYRRRMLERAAKVLAHETGHMFGLPHCIYFQCVLNGANSLEEADRQPHQLCPVCLRKLYRNIGFDPVQRYRELDAFYRRHGWTDQALWTTRQLAKAAGP
jgi:archaemetzincin